VTWAQVSPLRDEDDLHVPSAPFAILLRPSRPPCAALPCAARAAASRQCSIFPSSTSPPPPSRPPASPPGQDSGHLTEDPRPPVSPANGTPSASSSFFPTHSSPSCNKSAAIWSTRTTVSHGCGRCGGEPSERAQAEAERAPCTKARGSRTAAGVGLKRQTSGVGVHESAPGPGVHLIFFPRRCGSRAAHTQQAMRGPRETTERRIDKPRRASSPGTCRPGSS